MKNKDSYIKNVADMAVEDIVKGIRDGIVAFNELQNTGEFSPVKQKQVKKRLEEFEVEDNAHNAATTLPLLRDFLISFPQSEHCGKVKEKIRQKEAEERDMQREKFAEIQNNINDYKPDEVKSELGEIFLRDLCKDLDIDYNVVVKYDEPELSFNDVPQNPEDVPSGYTDVFFWGIPSSGKTCALSVILRTMKDKYTMTNPSIATKFGATYRDSLVNIFSNKTGYLPAATQKDRTQYMPFLLKRRGENNYRQVSFFELSGEVFKYFYELEHGRKILEEGDRGNVENAFRTLNLLLNSKNQKIHFFFIDYKQETKGTKDKHNLTQENYLNAAATYFRDKNDIFKKRTDAVYVVVTKADEIKSENKTELAKQFLSDNFGSFMDVIKNRCKVDRVDFNVKIFSIGDVYFKGICKINYLYAENIVEDLLKKIKPVSENLLSKILNG
jgi:hypothetical protein